MIIPLLLAGNAHAFICLLAGIDKQQRQRAMAHPAFWQLPGPRFSQLPPIMPEQVRYRRPSVTRERPAPPGVGPVWRPVD